MRLHIKYLAHLVLIAALLLLTACGNDSPKMVITTQNGITTYNGIDWQMCHVADGERRELHISVSRQDGSISISVLQTEEQKYAYRGNDIPTSDFIIALSEPGEYCIEINAKDFRGNYDILDCPETQNYYKGKQYDLIGNYVSLCKVNWC